VFFIPECGDVLTDTKAKIESHGGILVDQHECFTYQIKPSDAKLKMRDFYSGTIYQSSWLDQAIENQKGDLTNIGGNQMIQLKDDHKLIDNTKDNCRLLNIGKKKHFTIVEGIKLFSVMSSNNTDNLNKMTFWQSIEKYKMIPERTAEQMKKFWTKYEHYTVE
jgi:hypothetical protein